MRGSPNVSEAELRSILGDVPKIIGDARAADVLVRRADELAQKIRKLKMAQARDIFDELRQIESLWMRNPDQALRRLHLLRPKMAYRTKRIPELEPLAMVLDSAVLEVVNTASESERKERFRRLVEFAEAVVAYHKYYGGE